MCEALVKRLRAQADAERYFVGEDMLYDKAADAIEELSATISKMEIATRWIPVTERLPREQKTVLTWGKLGVILLDWRHDSEWCCFGDVTHWMPLPEPPEEKPTCEDCQRECQMMGLDMEACASYDPSKEEA